MEKRVELVAAVGQILARKFNRAGLHAYGMEHHLVDLSRTGEMNPHPLRQMLILTVDPAMRSWRSGNQGPVERAHTLITNHSAIAKAARIDRNLHARFAPKRDVSVAAGASVFQIGNLRPPAAGHGQKSQEGCRH